MLWRDEAPRPGWLNMAIDQALLDQAERDGTAVLRLYRWAPFCLSFGCHEPAARRYDRDRIRSLGLDVVRRPTGGRGVWHARELTYAVAAPGAYFGSLAETYRRIHEAIASALRSLGAEATLAPAPARMGRLEAGACFAQPAGGEVMVGGRKVVGSAQLRQGAAFLQHGSILLEDDQRQVTELLPAAAGGREPAPLAAPLAARLGRPVGWEAAADAIATATAAWAADRRPLDDTAPVLGQAERHHDRFRSDAWTWRR